MRKHSHGGCIAWRLCIGELELMLVPVAESYNKNLNLRDDFPPRTSFGTPDAMQNSDMPHTQALVTRFMPIRS